MTNNDTITFTSYGETFVLTPEFTPYPNNRLCIRLFDEEGPFCTLTTNLPDQHLNEGEFFIKDWSENAEIVSHLLKLGVLVDTGREVASGFVSPKVMRWTL